MAHWNVIIITLSSGSPNQRVDLDAILVHVKTDHSNCEPKVRQSICSVPTFHAQGLNCSI